MTYIGIGLGGGAGLRSQRAARDRKVDESREKKTEEKERSVDWKLIVEISLLLFFFFSRFDKSDKRTR